jgi:hypothetical protein
MDRLDPDFPHLVGRPGPVYGSYGAEPAIGATPIPVYVAAKELPASQLRDLLLASSALPHGVFPGVEIESTVYIDGGISDNLPIYAILNKYAVSELVVICCNPMTEEQLVAAWRKAERLQRLRLLEPMDALKMRAASPAAKAVLTFNPPAFLRYVSPPAWPTTITLVAPAQPLGNLLTATLNFGRKRARQLLQLGWADARRVAGADGIPEKLSFEELRRRLGK